MKRYWIRIAIGAMGIFAIGMLIVAAGRRGVARVRELAMNRTVTLPANVAPFRVDGKRLGFLSQIKITPNEGRSFPRLNLVARLDDSVSAEGLDNCNLVARDANDFPGENGLHCSATHDSGQKLVEMGTITIQPENVVLSLYVPESNLQGKSWFDSSPSATLLTVSRNHEGLNLQADSSGAFMLIQDKKGHPLFQLNADSNGAFIQIHDSNGREVMRFRADSNGVTGRLKSHVH